jgi:transposase
MKKKGILKRLWQEYIMRNQDFPVKLSASERSELEQIVRTGQQKARIRERAQILLWSDAGKSDLEIAGLLHRTPLTIAETRKRWAIHHTLSDQPKRGRNKRLDGKQEALLVALACSEAPDEREGWTMQMLADKLVELKVIDAPISDETVRRTLKKMSLSPGSKTSGASQP